MLVRLWKPQILDSPQATLGDSQVDRTSPDELSFPGCTPCLCLQSLESSWPSAPWISKGECDRAAERPGRPGCPRGCSRAVPNQPPSPWHSMSLHSPRVHRAKLCPLYKHTCSVRPSQRTFHLSSASSFSHSRDESLGEVFPALALLYHQPLTPAPALLTLQGFLATLFWSTGQTFTVGN